jgi:hypothetical protein
MIGKAIDYLKDSQDPADKRRRIRLPVVMPVMFGFPSAAECDFRQAMSLDISSSGIQIELLDPSPATLEKITKKDETVSLRFDMPKRKGLLNAEGKVCWQKEVQAADHLRLRVGIEFLPISLNSQIELMTYAVGLARRKMIGRISLTVGAVLLVLSVIAGTAVFVSRAVIQQDRDASQRILSHMEQKLQEVAKQKMELEQQIEAAKKKTGR